jgi:SAM-dependent methyltransferase
MSFGTINVHRDSNQTDRRGTKAVRPGKSNKNFISRLKDLYWEESFYPSLLSIFINPYYFIRKGLLNGIKANAHYISGKTLDFGCGSKPYEKMFGTDIYIGIDIEREEDYHKKSKIDAFFDGHKIPFGDGSFESVISMEVFQLLFNIEDVLDELYRVLRPGGYMLITVPFVWPEHDYSNDYARYTSFGIWHVLEKKGFIIVKCEKTTNHVETVFQTWNAYLCRFILPQNKFLQVLLGVFITAPNTLLGMLLSKMLPDNRDFFLNNIVVARKPFESVL